MESGTGSGVPLKKQKKVSFDTKVHRVNFARKSTFLRHGHIQRRRVSTKFAQRMLLELTKVDITGYKLTDSSESGECARMIPVEGILSCSRTNLVNLGRCSSTQSHVDNVITVKADLSHEVATMRAKGRKLSGQRSEESQVSSLHCMETSEDSLEELQIAKPPCKKSKAGPQKQELETFVHTPTEKHVLDNNASKESTPKPIAKSPDEIKYDLKLNETIEKITGCEEVKKKKKKKRSVLYVVCDCDDIS